MRIKRKLTSGTTFLFLLIAALVVVGTYFIHRLASDSGNIIQDNYASLEYCRDMQKSLNKMHSSYRINSVNKPENIFDTSDIKEADKSFTSSLRKEENNITEPGEKESVAALRSNYEIYLKLLQAYTPSSNSVEKKFNELHSGIIEIMNINMAAMKAKNEKANKTGKQAVLYMSLLGTVAFLLAFTLLLNFPGYIANPIIDITEKIKEITKKNFSQRIEFPGRRDELGELADAFNTMVEKLGEYEKSSLADLINEKGRIDSIVKSLDEGIILLDENQKIKVFNPVASELLGIPAAEAMDKYAPDLAINNDLFRELIKNIPEGTPSNGKPLRITIAGEENFFKKEIFKVQRENMEFKSLETAGYIISLRNITEYKKLDLAKTNFIAIVSHELKTPISSINLSLKLLEDNRVGELNEEQKNLVFSVKEETTRLSKITGELLDISQVETGNIKLSIESVNPADIVRFSEEVARPHIKDKKIELAVEISKEIPPVKADLEKTVWVMTNLLINAVRYTAEYGKIRIVVQPSLKEIQFSVEDNGQGIDPKNRERIFQRFVQVDRKQSQGVGLGLAISKEFIQEQGGKIWVESEIGVGSKFVFTLPVV